MVVQAALVSCITSYKRPNTSRIVQVRCANGGLGLLQASTPLTQHRGRGGCKTPTKPVPLRRQVAAPDDVVVELVTASSSHSASCALPLQLDLPQELASIVGLGALHPATLVPRLQQVQQLLAALGEEQRCAIASCPAFIGFLERSLELVGQRGLGPAAPTLLLCLLSLLRFGGTDAQTGRLLREGYANFHRHVVNALEDSVKREPQGLTPLVVLHCYEAWAGMDLPVTPPKSSLVATKLRDHLRSSALSVEECMRLFQAVASIHARSDFRPCNYDVSDLISGFLLGIRDLDCTQLSAVVAACAVFDWPVYRSPVWALDRVAQEAVRRLGSEELTLIEAEALLGQAVQAARCIRPRLGAEMEGRVEQWMLAHGAVEAAQGLASWAEAEAAAKLSNAVAFSLAQQQQTLLGARAPPC